MEIILLILTTILTIIGTPMVMKMLETNEIVALNFKKIMIPMPLGIVFIFVQLISLSLYIVIDKNIEIILYLFGILTMGLVGLLDDLAGDIKVKGLKGHIKSFFKGELTTGFVKAALGFFISLVISTFISNSIGEIIFHSFIIALSINAMNLFDLRPGRTIKVFLLLSIIFLLLSEFNRYFIIVSMILITLAYLPYDIKAKAMMGDTGSNVLGLTLGIYVVLSQILYIKIAYLLLLIFLHILAEKKSISKIIENNKILKYIDEIGR